MSFRKNLPFGYYFRALPLYTDFSVSRQMYIGGFPFPYRSPNLYFQGLFPHRGRLLLYPEAPNLSMQDSSATHAFVGGFRLLPIHHCIRMDPPQKYPCCREARIAMRLEAVM